MNKNTVRIKKVTNEDGNLLYEADVNGEPFTCVVSQGEFDESVATHGTVFPLIEQMYQEFKAMGAEL